MIKLSSEQKLRIKELLAEDKSTAYICAAVGCSDWTVKNERRKLSRISEEIKAFEEDCTVPESSFREPQREQTEINEISGDNWTVSLQKTRIHTLEQLIAYCEVDLDVWEVERFVCNKWEVGAVPRATREISDDGWSRPHKLNTPAAEPMHNEKDWNGGLLRVYPLYQVKAWFKRNRKSEFAKKQVLKLKEEAFSYAPLPQQFKLPSLLAKRNKRCVEIALTDVHIGALIWSKETGHEDYDIKIGVETFKSAFVFLVNETIHHKPEKILLIIGNDLANVDNRATTTERGTLQVNDGRYEKMYEAVKECIRFAVEYVIYKLRILCQVIAVRGNHDPLTTYHLADFIEALFSRCPRVTVDNSPVRRKMWTYGVNAVLFTHGDSPKNIDKNVTLTAAEFPEEWGASKYREVHTGDRHHRELVEYPGIALRILPSLRPPCVWSVDNGFVGTVRAGMAFVWDEKLGLIGESQYNIFPPKKKYVGN